jgi:hypothetical protein
MEMGALQEAQGLLAKLGYKGNILEVRLEG